MLVSLRPAGLSGLGWRNLKSTKKIHLAIGERQGFVGHIERPCVARFFLRLTGLKRSSSPSACSINDAKPALAGGKQLE
jgi:hypothetical protein